MIVQKIFKFTNYSIYGHTFLAITQQFFDQSGWNFLWELRKLLSIDCWYEINVMALSFLFRFLGPFLAGKWAWPPRWRLRIWGQKTDQKVGPRWGPFGSHVISKSCSRNFWPWTPRKVYKLLFCQMIDLNKATRYIKRDQVYWNWTLCSDFLHKKSHFLDFQV